MRAIEFKSKLGNKYIHIPKRFQAELKNADKKTVRVIIFMEDTETADDLPIIQATKDQFLKGYSDLDSIYDH